MGKSAPAAPDYTAAAEATAASDQAALAQQTWANRMSQNNPWGSVDYEATAGVDPSTGEPITQWTQNTTLDPTLQRALQSQMNIQEGKSMFSENMIDQAGNALQNPMDWNNFSEYGQTPQGADQQRTKAEDASYQNATRRLDPQFADEANSLEVSLRNRGLSEGDQAFDSAMEKFGMRKNDAYANAQNQSFLAGGSEAQRNQGMDLASSGYQNNLRQSQVQEQLMRRGQPLNEMNALLTGAQVQSPTFQGFNQAGRAAATDYSGAAGQQYQAGLDSFNANQAATQGMMSGGMQAASMFSDRRLKRAIKKIGKIGSLNVYSFMYLWSDKVYKGFMADEVKEVVPEAVIRTPVGYDAVDYNMVLRAI